MFRKPLVLSTGHKVSGADRKKLRRSLQKAFPSVSAEELETGLPAKDSELSTAKIAAPSRGMIYSLGAAPLFVDVSGKEDYLPAVYALWRLPSLLPRVLLKHPDVSHFLIGGADLMLPGVDLMSLPAMLKGTLCSVCVPGNPAPLGVGRACMSSQDVIDRGGGKGKLLEMLHVYGDTLWALCSGPESTPNAGYLAAVVQPLAAPQPADQDAATSAAKAAQYLSALQLTALAGPGGPGQAGSVANGNVERGHANGSTGSIISELDADGGASTSAEQRAHADEVAVSPQQMDALLERSLLQALSKTITDSVLPLPAGLLWNAHMLPARPEGAHLDLKRSSHKRMAKFLQAYGGDGNLLHLREEKYSHETAVTCVNRSHPLLASFRLHPTTNHLPPPGAAEPEIPAVLSPGNLQIEELFKVSGHVVPVFEAVGAPKEHLYSRPEAGEVAFTYVQQCELTKGTRDRTQIMLDPRLCDALLKGLLKKGETFPTHLPKAQLRDMFVGRMLPQLRITRGSTQVVKKGTLSPIIISVLKRQGNKRITRIVGVEPFLIDPSALAGQLQKKFASATTVGELLGKQQGAEVLLQGNVPAKVASFLEDNYGMPAKYMQVTQALK